MSADGTITLVLRAWPKPPAESRLVYMPGDSQYGDIKRHLGDIAPGQSKEVPPAVRNQFRAVTGISARTFCI